MSGSETKTFTLAMGQILVEGGKPQRNVRRAINAIDEAANKGSDVIVLPEVLDCGWCDESARELAGPIPGGTSFEELATAAATHRITVCAGLTEREGGRIYNAAVLIDPHGSLVLKHRKVNELEIGKEVYSTGTAVEAVRETALGAVGLMICADGFIEGETVSRTLADLGARIILSPCAWAVPPDHDQGRQPYGDLWRDVYGRVAKEHGIWICGTSNVGSIRHGEWAGHHCIGCSMVVGPDGEVRVSCPYGTGAEGIVYARIF